jgi:hypothetical protein
MEDLEQRKLEVLTAISAKNSERDRRKARGLDVKNVEEDITELSDELDTLLSALRGSDDRLEARRAAIEEVKPLMEALPRIAAEMDETAALLAKQVNRFRSLEGAIRKAVFPVVDSSTRKSLHLDVTISGGTALLPEAELAVLVERIPRGQEIGAASVTDRIKTRCSEALRALGRACA